MKATSYARLRHLPALLLLLALCAPLASAQYKKSVRRYPSTVAAQTKMEGTQPQPQADPSPEQSATPEPTPAPAGNTQPLAENERLPFMLEDAQKETAEAPSAGGLLIRTLGALLLIVGLIVAAGWGLRRFGGARFGAPREDAPQLTVLTSVSLGDRRSLAIVRFGEQNLLIGSTAQSMTLLASEELESGETKTPIVRSVADLLKAGEAKDFAEELIEATEQLDESGYAGRADGGTI